MSTHTITVELPVGAYRLLREMVESGEYADESQVISEALLTLSLEPTTAAPFEPGNPEFDLWIKEDVLPALADLDSGKDDGYTLEEVKTYLEQERQSLPSQCLTR